MKYYAAQIKTRAEEKFIKLFKALHPQENVTIYFPMREIIERHKGKHIQKLLPVFPGYIFIEIQDAQNIFDYYWLLNKMPFFYHFLKSNNEIQKMDGRDLEIIRHFIKTPNGKKTAVSEISQVYFNEDDRIVVLSGALAGLEGNIIKIDKRKGRVKVKLDLCGEKFSIDLAFENIESRRSVGHL
ncbi:MAG: transcription termination/antitermination protein NusG [Termitinemataceae bacterium]|nr:MAG: transcription termination/antitermination protein NusG [Termitinemataceae bacterium]